jgi:hypothetical protein
MQTVHDRLIPWRREGLFGELLERLRLKLNIEEVCGPTLSNAFRPVIVHAHPSGPARSSAALTHIRLGPA